ASEAVGGGPRMRARAPRPDLQEPDLVHRRDAAAAGTDLDQLDGGEADRQPAALDEAPLARRLEGIRGERLTVVHQRELRGGAAHVEGEHIPGAVRLAEEGGRDGAGRRTPLEPLHGHPPPLPPHGGPRRSRASAGAATGCPAPTPFGPSARGTSGPVA